jgi:hypothetical protein
MVGGGRRQGGEWVNSGMEKGKRERKGRSGTIIRMTGAAVESVESVCVGERGNCGNGK